MFSEAIVWGESLPISLMHTEAQFGRATRFIIWLLDFIRQESLGLPSGLLKGIEHQPLLFIIDVSHKNEIEGLHQEEHPYGHGPHHR